MNNVSGVKIRKKGVWRKKKRIKKERGLTLLVFTLEGRCEEC